MSRDTIFENLPEVDLPPADKSPSTRGGKESINYFDSLAPEWDSINTDDERLSDILSNLHIKTGERILDVGCGTGRLMHHIKKYLHYEGIVCGLDYSFQMLLRAQQKEAQNGIWFINGNAERMPFDKETFDKLICFAVFPHIEDKVTAVQEFFRILKNGGILVIFHLSSRDELNEFHKNLNSVVSRHILPDKHSIRTMLTNAGFRDIITIDKPDLNYTQCVKY